MNNLSLQFHTIAEREPKDGEQVLFKAKDLGLKWELGTFEQFSGLGAVFVTATAHISKDTVAEYAVLPDI